MEEIIMYSTNELCAKCQVLKQKLEQKKIKFELVANTKKMRELGFLSAPFLWNGKEYLDFKESVEWVNNISKEE